MKKNERPDHIGTHGPGITKSPALERLAQGTRHLTGTCAGCVFWDTTDPDVRPGMGVCRGDVAQLVSVGGPNGNTIQALWPVTGFSATCGKHMTPADYAARLAFKRGIWGL